MFATKAQRKAWKHLFYSPNSSLQPELQFLPASTHQRKNDKEQKGR